MWIQVLWIQILWIQNLWIQVLWIQNLWIQITVDSYSVDSNRLCRCIMLWIKLKSASKSYAASESKVHFSSGAMIEK